MPRRQPRKPSIGLNSCSASTRACDAARPRCPSRFASSAWPLSSCGRNSCSGGSSSADRHRPALHRLEDALEVGALERQQLGQRLLARPPASPPGSSRASSPMWSKNMCSVRHRPMPSAPKAIACAPGRACRRWCGPSACGTRRPTPSAWRTAGTIGDCSGFSVLSMSTCTTSLGLVATWPAMTSPVKPSMVMQSPSFSTSCSPTVTVCLPRSRSSARRSRRRRPCPSAG